VLTPSRQQHSISLHRAAEKSDRDRGCRRRVVRATGESVPGAIHPSDPLDHALLRTLLSGSTHPELNPLSASRRKDLTRKLLVRALCAQVKRKPTIVLVEDLHWADPTTVELLQEVLRLAERIQLLVLLTSREAPAPSFAQRTNLMSIRLTRLPRRECNELIDRKLSAAQLRARGR
jgi:predicted ATPase